MKISGSILTNSMKPKEAINYYNKSTIDYIHLDVMDGKFVENKSYTLSDIEKFATYTTKPFDVHLMVKNPDKYIDTLSMLNTSYITFHYEVVTNHLEIIEHIKNNGIKVGISLKPDTELNKIIELLPHIDLVLIMSVEPGKSGQKFMESILPKIKELKNIIGKNNYNIIINVDGGINEETSHLAKESGADMLVSCSYLLGGDLEKKLKILREI